MKSSSVVRRPRSRCVVRGAWCAVLVGWMLCRTALALAGQAPPSAGAPAITEYALTKLAGHYVMRFVEEFSNIVVEERYVQDVIGALPSRTAPTDRHRETTSDLLLVRVGGRFAWRPFRDVFQVGNTPVRDRDERLTRLFSHPSMDAIGQAERISEESARYNIGGVLRTVNTPVHILLFLDPQLQPRFDFTLDKRDAALGPNVWIVRYHEHARPTLIRGEGDTDLAASGRFWIDAQTGQVAKTEVVFFNGKGTAEITTSFRQDPRFGVAVPTDVHERYAVDRRQVIGTATYSNFRRFEVSTATTTAPVR